MGVVKNQFSPSIILGLLMEIDSLDPKEASKNAHTYNMICRLMCITELTITKFVLITLTIIID